MLQSYDHAERSQAVAFSVSSTPQQLSLFGKVNCYYIQYGNTVKLLLHPLLNLNWECNFVLRQVSSAF